MLCMHTSDLLKNLLSEAFWKTRDRKPKVEIDLVDAGLTFSVRFPKKRHLDESGVTAC